MAKVCDCGVKVLAIDIIVEDDLDLYSDGTTESSRRGPDGGGFYGTGYVYCPKCKQGFFIDQETGKPNFETNHIVMDMEGAVEPIPGIEIVVRRKGTVHQTAEDTDVCSDV